MVGNTQWELDVIGPEDAELALWDRIEGDDVFIRLHMATGEACLYDYADETEHKIDVVRFLCDIAHEGTVAARQEQGA